MGIHDGLVLMLDKANVKVVSNNNIDSPNQMFQFAIMCLPNSSWMRMHMHMCLRSVAQFLKYGTNPARTRQASNYEDQYETRARCMCLLGRLSVLRSYRLARLQFYIKKQLY